MFAGMKHGETQMVRANDLAFLVHYHSHQSYGDDNRPVEGAVTGKFTVEHPSGRVTHHEHGPFAETAAARKRGASGDSKHFAADQALTAIKRTASASTVKKHLRAAGYTGPDFIGEG